MTVIDIRTRQTRSAPIHIVSDMSDQEAAYKYAEGCIDRIWIEAKKLRAIAGLSTALRVLGKIGFELGRTSCVKHGNTSASTSSLNASKTGSETFGPRTQEPQKS